MADRSTRAGAGRGFTAADRLLLTCLTRPFGGTTALPSATEPASAVDWDRAAGLALRDGLAALVHAGLGDRAQAIPEAARTRLRAAHAASVLTSQARIAPALRQVLEALQGAGLTPIVLKGAALAHTAYPRPSYRTMSDIDLLLPPGQLERAREVLAGAGFREEARPARATHHLTPFRSDRALIPIELHYDLLPAENPYALAADQFIRRARTARLGSIDGLVLDPADALHHACVHLAYAHRYRWYLLRGLVDILAITWRYGASLNWDDFLSAAVAARTGGAVYWPLRLARGWLGAEVPAPVLARLAPPAPLRRLLEPISEPGFLLDPEHRSGSSTAVLRTVLRDLSLHTGCPIGVQLRAALGGLFPPRSAVGHLPPAVAASRLRYGLYLLSPRRCRRGIAALLQLLAMGR